MGRKKKFVTQKELDDYRAGKRTPLKGKALIDRYKKFFKRMGDQ